LQFTIGNPNAKVIFIEDLTPISVEELPPSNFFFSKKRKVVVKREIHQREGSSIKIHRVLIYGEALEKLYFVEEVASSLGAFSTANKFSIGNLKERMKQKDLKINQLQNQMKIVEKNVWSKVHKEFEQIRASDK
jgi:hypothetical protein